MVTRSCGRPQLRAGGHGAPAVFPTGKSAAIFHYPTRQCICLFRPPPAILLLPRGRPNSRKSVVPLPVLRHGRAPHFAGHDNVFIIHWIIRGALAEIRWDGIMRHYRLYRIGDLPAHGAKKSCRSDIPASSADFNVGTENGQ